MSAHKDEGEEEKGWMCRCWRSAGPQGTGEAHTAELGSAENEESKGLVKINTEWRYTEDERSIFTGGIVKHLA